MEDNEEDDEDEDEDDDVEDNEEDADGGNTDMMFVATADTRSLVVSGIVSVVESTSGTTMSCNEAGVACSSGLLRRRLLQFPEVDG